MTSPVDLVWSSVGSNDSRTDSWPISSCARAGVAPSDSQASISVRRAREVRLKLRPARVAALIALPITMPAIATMLRTSGWARRSPKMTISAAIAPDSTPATAIRRPCQSSLIRLPEVHDAVVSISSTNAATVHGTARIPRSSSATMLSWTAARTTTTSGNHPSPTRAQRPRATVRPVSVSRPAPKPAYDAIPCTRPS